MNRIILKISIRNILRDRVTTFTCIAGLALGFAAYILISSFVRYELSWDKHNTHFERVVAIKRDVTNVVGNNISPVVPALTAPLLEEYHHFEAVTLISSEDHDNYLSADPLQQIRVEEGIYADHNYLKVFTYSFVHGGSPDALNDPFSILLSESLANRLFGSNNPIGETVSLNKKVDLRVEGVYVDLPQNSTIRPEYIISFATLEPIAGVTRNDFWNVWCMAFALLKSESSTAAALADVEDMFTSYSGMEYNKTLLIPLASYRLDDMPDYLIIFWIFGLMGLFILAMSAFNYVNLSIASASMRGKEIAIKKINGSTRYRLVWQLLTESITLSLLAYGLALLVVLYLLPIFNSIMGTAITLNIANRWQLILALGAVLIGIMAGLYPAVFMSSHGIMNLFRNTFLKSRGEGISVRRVLVTLQFAMSIFLLSISFFFAMQIKYITTKDLGLRMENIIYTRVTASASDHLFDNLRSRVLQNPEIVDASMSRNLPFVNLSGGETNWEGGDPSDRVLFRPNYVTYDFVSTLGLRIIDGRDFSRDFPSDISSGCIINQAAVRAFGWDNPVGKRLNNNQWTVVGVVEDYHLMDVHNPIDPAVLVLNSGELVGGWTLAFRYASGSLNKAKQILHNEIDRMLPNDPFELHVLESAFRNEFAFKTYHSINRAVALFTIFSILLAVIGLLGMVSFTTLRRTKEIGVRKINGSSVASIFTMLNREFLVMLVVSLAIAWPGAWLFHTAFPGGYKVPLHPLILIGSGLIILVITLVTTSYHTYRAATRNPIEALRYE